MDSTPLEKFRSSVTCSKCGELFKEPKTLPCLHTYCKACLEKLVTQAGEDKSCVEQENLKNSCDPHLCCALKNMKVHDVNHLQTNYGFANIIRHLHLEDTLISEEGTKCYECEEDLANCFCKECNKALCEDCKKHHKRARKSKDHLLQPIDEIRSKSSTEGLKGVSTRVSWKCYLHPDKDVDMYCFDCDVVLCLHCSVTDPHCTHRKKFAKDVLDKPTDEFNFKAELNQHITSTTQVCGKFEEAIGHLEEVKKSLQGSNNKARKEVEERYDEIVAELSKQKDALLQSADGIFERKKKILNEQLEELQRVKATLQSSLHFTNEILDVGIPTEILFLKTAMRDRLRELTERYGPYNREPYDNDIISFTVNGGLDLENAIGTVTGDPHIGEFTADDPSPQDLHLIQGRQGTFKVTCRDIYGNRLSENPRDICVEIQPNDEGDVTRGDIEKENGVYKITLTPQRSGLHTLQIYTHIRDKQVHIKGSPFQVNVFQVPTEIQQAEHEIRNDSLQSPWGLAVNNNGQIVVSDVSKHHLVLFDENYQLVRIIGKKGAGQLEFDVPRGVAFNPVNGQIVVVEVENHRVQIVTPDGEYVHMFGERGEGAGQFSKPVGVTVNKHGHIFIADSLNQRVQYFKSDGTILGQFGGWGTELGQFNEPYAITVNDCDHILVVGREGVRVQVFRNEDDVYKAVSQFGKGEGVNLRKPVGISYDMDNKYISMTDMELHCVSIFSRNGDYVSSFGSMGSGAVQFRNPMSVVALRGHRLVVADCGNARLVVFRYLE